MDSEQVTNGNLAMCITASCFDIVLLDEIEFKALLTICTNLLSSSMLEPSNSLSYEEDDDMKYFSQHIYSVDVIKYYA